MASPFFFIGKKDRRLQPCQDYHHLNNYTVKNAYPIPLISALFNKLKGAKWFTKFDIRDGYNNIRIRKGDEWKGAFKTPHGLFEPTVMFFGMCNSPATFQAFMDSMFGHLVKQGGVIVYMDNILIYAANRQELDRLTKEVLKILRKNDLYLRPRNVNLRNNELNILEQ
ncbi:hypothetical protein NP233_g308 [Leucocoprinus birnbaumii]|uniref:Reverse transcriptase domain-containing protein n=1 Tax=Leucocoprinus birnbaumii TaxID=56174 RepID=A0AAD5W2D6_9AGAR|nr:hypothetical protein NP233_g308 [Leucocoprinus birnbaumii]